MKKRRLSSTSFYVILICAFLLAVNAVLGFALMSQSRRSLKTLIHNRMLDISNTAADMLDGDILAALRAEDEDTPEYQAALRILRYFQDNIDLNGLKGINDSCGHEEGDRAITEAGAVLKSIFGSDGRLYRIGGDEFVALLKKTEAEMQALFSAFGSSIDKRNAGDAEILTEMSMGWAVFDSGRDREYRAVFKRADDAMYADKAAYYKTHPDRRRG